MWAVILLALGAFLAGGAISFRQQKMSKLAVGVMAVLALMSLVGGALWAFSGGS